MIDFGISCGRYLFSRTLAGLYMVLQKQELQEKLEAVNPSKCLGEIGESGVACAWTCSTHSGYLVGQNIIIDDRRFNSTF